MKQYLKKSYSPGLLVLVLFVLSIPLIMPYFKSGYFPSHDGEWAVVRLGDMFRSVKEFQFPVRYSGYLNFTYGYPLFNFAYPMPYYLGLLPLLMNMGLVGSIKFLFAISVPLSGIGMFLFSKTIWKSVPAGFISAILYMYLPYRMVDLYVRGSIGESLSFVLFPFILFFLVKQSEKSKHILFLICASISYAVLILTHNIMALLFTPVILLVSGVFLYRKALAFKAWSVFLLLSFGLSAFFWIPALMEKGSILLSKIPIADRSLYFVRIDQLLIPSWGYGAPTEPDGFTYQLGIGHVITFCLAFYFVMQAFILKKKTAKSTHLALLFCEITLIMILLLFPLSAPVWQYTPLLKEINYPFTLLPLIGFVISLLGGYVLKRGKTMILIMGAVVCLSVVLVLPYAKPQSYFDKGDGYYLTNQATTTSSNELMPLWVDKHPSEAPKQKVEILNGSGEIQNISHNARNISFAADLTDDAVVRVNTIYYPGWELAVDGIRKEISYENERGVMEVSVPKGRHIISAVMHETPLRFLSNAVSVMSLFTILMLFLYSLFKLRRKTV